MVTMAMINDVKLSLGNARVTIVGFKIVIPHPLGPHGIYCLRPRARPRAQAINPIQPSWVWYNYYISYNDTRLRHIEAYVMTLLAWANKSIEKERPSLTKASQKEISFPRFK